MAFFKRTWAHRQVHAIHEFPVHSFRIRSFDAHSCREGRGSQPGGAAYRHADVHGLTATAAPWLPGDVEGALIETVWTKKGEILRVYGTADLQTPPDMLHVRHGTTHTDPTPLPLVQGA